jgi:hypothetical protein
MNKPETGPVVRPFAKLSGILKFTVCPTSVWGQSHGIVMVRDTDWVWPERRVNAAGENAMYLLRMNGVPGRVS